MTGSHEVRGSIPLGSTNRIYNLQGISEEVPFLMPLSVPPSGRFREGLREKNC
jgi:hypothetical protein